MTERRITGYHVLFGFVAAFGVIISVNLYLAFSAVKTFPGLEVKNSYVASQQFNAQKAAQEALGWEIDADHSDGLLVLSITDKNGPVRVQSLTATLGRATTVADDLTPDLVFNGTAYVAPVELRDGNWNIRMVALAPDGTTFQQRVILHVVR
ncbi:MAG: FixH family protein [Paracoccaceae bacterium]|nr:FixH family protein [Paracoccaceae bacterium]MDG1739463.1 FixH family protein [Paracoccaceae bacterium]MDG2258619.1 FixH family protein [Paracoccaceae bacterium]